MPAVVPHLKLTQEGARRILDAAIAKAQAMHVPQCIAVVDDGGHLLAFARMDGAKVLSIDSSLRKTMIQLRSLSIIKSFQILNRSRWRHVQDISNIYA